MTDTLAEFVAGRVERFKSLRGGDPRVTMAEADAAADAIEARVGRPSGALSEVEREALMAVQRLTYNAAADGWPGWKEISAWPAPTKAELEQGLALARRSSALVERLGVGPLREGTSHWIIGAYHLALGEICEALAAFTLAVTRYRLAATPTWLVQGYIAITYEAAARARPRSVASFGEVLAAIEAGGFKEASAWREQLIVARAVFVRGSQLRHRSS